MICHRKEKDNEGIKFKIRNALGLKEHECDIKEVNQDTFIISPVAREKELRIDVIKNVYKNNSKIYLFQLCNLTFKHCVFECEIELLEVLDKSIDNKIIFESCVFQRLFRCNDITFAKGIVFKDSTFEAIASFVGVAFGLETNFSNCKFQSEVDFSQTNFYEETNFGKSIFKASAYFDCAKFKGKTIFSRSEFYKSAHFYQAEFNKNPDFFQIIFNECLNLTGAIIFDFNFEQIKLLIEKESEKTKVANKYRDVFKKIKNALIKSGNLLGASRFHKMELYCKEIELGLKKEKPKKDFRDTFIKNNNISNAQHGGEAEACTKEHKQKQEKSKKSDIRDTIDRIQLYCYRVTSDHHTDLLLILNNVIFLIALFGCINLVFVVFLQYCDAIASILWSLISCVMFISVAIYFILELEIDRSYIDVPIKVLLVTIELFIFGILSGICGIMVIFFIELIGIFEKRIKRISMLILSYFIVLFTLLSQPSFLLPILGKIMDNEKSNSVLAFESLNIVYTIFLFLLLFSLQKTARKNTIVPN